MADKRYRWYHGIAIYAGVQALEFGFRAIANGVARGQGLTSTDAAGGDRDAYEQQRLPAFAPPGIAFPIAWTINSVSQLAGLLHVLNLPEETDGRAAYLRLQVATWTLYALFDAAYFGLRSPINAAAVTAAYSAVIAASLDVALRRLPDRRAAYALATTVAWLALANPVAVGQVAMNRDPFWDAVLRRGSA
jgi:tryptophan-rich sensory protein